MTTGFLSTKLVCYDNKVIWSLWKCHCLGASGPESFSMNPETMLNHSQSAFFLSNLFLSSPAQNKHIGLRFSNKFF